MPRVALLLVLCLAPALVGLAAVPTAAAHVCIEGQRAHCGYCPDLGLFHLHLKESVFVNPFCVLP